MTCPARQRSKLKLMRAVLDLAVFGCLHTQLHQPTCQASGPFQLEFGSAWCPSFADSQHTSPPGSILLVIHTCHRLTGALVQGASFWRLAQYNRPEWHWALAGVIGSALQGAIMPSFAVALSSLIGSYYSSDIAYLKHQTTVWCLVLAGQRLLQLSGPRLMPWLFVLLQISRAYFAVAWLS